MTFRRVRLTDGQEHIVYDDLICKLPLRAEAVRRRYREIYKEACTCRKWVEIVKGLRRQVIPQAAGNRSPSSGYSLFLGRVPLPALPLSVWLGLLFPHHSEQHLRLFLQDLIEAPAEMDVEGQIEEHVSGGADVL